MTPRFRARHERMLAQRKWLPNERLVVWRGLTGRFAIAIEPILGVIFFSLFAWGVTKRAQVIGGDHSLIVIAPLFWIGAAAFLIYAIAVMRAPMGAYLATFAPIYIVDGYVRYRAPDEGCEDGVSGYLAVLFADQHLAYEWQCFGEQPLPNLTLPAHVEFSHYGGVHKIDGTPTGILPEEVPLLTIGMARRR